MTAQRDEPHPAPAEQVEAMRAFARAVFGHTTPRSDEPPPAPDHGNVVPHEGTNPPAHDDGSRELTEYVRDLFTSND